MYGAVIFAVLAGYQAVRAGTHFAGQRWSKGINPAFFVLGYTGVAIFSNLNPWVLLAAFVAAIHFRITVNGIDTNGD